MSEIIKELKEQSKLLTDRQLRVLLKGILEHYERYDFMEEVDFEKIMKIALTY